MTLKTKSGNNILTNFALGNKMKTKTSDLTGAALAYTVGVADKRIMQNGIGGSIEVRGRTEDGEELPDDWDMWMLWYPQANWSQGGPIIERERIDLFTEKGTSESWVASIARYQHGKRLVGWRIHQYGPTPLIAAMRCFVANKLGDEVDVPDELC